MSPYYLIVLFACACAESYGDDQHLFRSAKRSVSQTTGCIYEARWYPPSTVVRSREPCLQCVCAQGALSCRRRACAPLPEPPPRCHVVHEKGECCAEIRCPDDLKHLENKLAARVDDTEIETPSSIGHACVEGGVVYAAGSAMSGGSACEQCFCLGGARRCVRPACLPPPPGCKARAASGACCPQRYYCEHSPSTNVAVSGNVHDCITPDGKWAYEGERVKTAEAAECMQCFCLRGAVRCQRLGCAPALRGCRPLLREGECCPHQYQCDNRNGTKIPNLYLQHQNTLMSLNDENRSFHTSKSTKRETTIKDQTTHKSTSAVTVTKEQPTTTVKVKRNTNGVSTDSNLKEEKSYTTALETTQTTISGEISTTEETTIKEFESMTTEQPESSVKIIINGTINCTAELSSTSLLLNVSDPNMWINSEIQPRIPIVNIEVESHTYSPNDIITERNDGGFDEHETFTINVTSSLRTNTSQSTTVSSATSAPKTVAPLLFGAVNISKVKKDEYDYDYPEPTLPPSLPNLKIIPFVAADAVVDEDISSKESLDYSLLETDDKFPVYYPSKDLKQPFAMRKEDVYNPTQYPIFVSKKVESQYPSITHEVDDVNIAYASITNDAPSQVHKYTVSAALDNSAKVNNHIEQKPSIVDTKFEMETPTVNLFSPPIETEGGFIPKGPGIMDEYYSVYQSTPPAPIIPHLTTSMQLEPKDECITRDGRHVLEGESVNVACSVCSCAWGALRCSLRPCNTPPGCERRASVVSTGDLCCGDLICDRNKTTPFPYLTTQNFAISLNETKVPFHNEMESVGFTKSEITKVNSTNIESNYTLNDYSDMMNQDILKQMEQKNSTNTSFTEISAPVSTTSHIELPQNNNNSAEYDEEEDEGFSFGSVLQLLLSETYETTTGTPKRKKTTVNIVPRVTTPVPTTKRKYQNTVPDNVFIPVTHRYPMPPKKVYPQNAVNRIDHLLLGEPTTLRKTTSRPSTTYKPIITTRKTFTTTTRSTPRPTTKTIEITNKDGVQQTADVRPAQNFISNVNLGLPKLAGCNIYGRMYRVGRIIAELSSPCQECKCTEFGVQCRSLNC